MATGKIASFEHRVHSMLLVHSAPKQCTELHYTKYSVLNVAYNTLLTPQIFGLENEHYIDIKKYNFGRGKIKVYTHKKISKVGTKNRG